MAAALESTVKFDAFAAEHEALERSLDALRGLLELRQDARATSATLADLSDHVAAHFLHEEQEDGLFDNLIEQAPRLKPQAEALMAEHATLTDALANLQAWASRDVRSRPWWNELSLRFEAFWKEFCRHERAEIDLVEEAFHDEIGPIA